MNALPASRRLSRAALGLPGVDLQTSISVQSQGADGADTVAAGPSAGTDGPWRGTNALVDMLEAADFLSPECKAAAIPYAKEYQTRVNRKVRAKEAAAWVRVRVVHGIRHCLMLVAIHVHARVSLWRGTGVTLIQR